MKFKNIPNIITIFRIPLSTALIFLKPLSFCFFIVYFLCGFSDVIDGFIARKFKLESKTGEFLDSIADSVFYAIIIIIIILTLKIKSYMIISVSVIAIIKMLSIILGYIKFKCFSALHTYLNKFTGIILFFFPFFIKIISLDFAVILCSVIAFISAVEEMIIIIKSKELNRNIKGLL